MTTASAEWIDVLTVIAGAEASWEFQIFKADGETPDVVSASDVFRFWLWQVGSEGSAPEIDASSVAASTGTFTVNTGTDFIAASTHGMENGDGVTVSSTGTLPAPLVANTTYYVISKTTDTFQLATEKGGSAIDITDAGSGTHTFSQRVSEITVTSVGVQGATPATVEVRLDQTDTEDLTGGGNYIGVLYIVDQSAGGSLKPIIRGAVQVIAAAQGTKTIS